MGDMTPDRKPPAEFQEVLRRVRQVDPACSENAVLRYVQEIAQAETMLSGLDVSDSPLAVSFSPDWVSESKR